MVQVAVHAHDCCMQPSSALELSLTPTGPITNAKRITFLYPGPETLQITALLCLALPFGIQAEDQVPVHG